MTEVKHPFIPIINEARLQAAMEYVAEQSLALAKTVLHLELNLDTLCFFSHSPKEYTFLEKAVRERGPESRFSHGPTLYVDSDFEIIGSRILIFGVRQPDVSRPQIGYGDYPVADYDRLVAAERSNPYAREIISGRGKSLLELRHPDFDVLGFVVDEDEHK